MVDLLAGRARRVFAIALSLGFIASAARASAAQDLPVREFPTGGEKPYFVRLADLNGDGNLDAVCRILNTNGNVLELCVLLGDGAGGFGHPIAHAAPVAVWAFDLADFNGDGRIDLAAVPGSPVTIEICPGTGTGSFGPSISTIYSPTNPNLLEIQALDIDGDGDVDVAASGQSSFAPLFNDGLGHLSQGPLYGFPGTVAKKFVWVRFGDLNNDNVVDAIVLWATNDPAVPGCVGSGCVLIHTTKSMARLGLGGGVFGPLTAPATLQSFQIPGWVPANYFDPNFQIADFSADGILDYVSTDGLASVGNGSGGATLPGVNLDMPYATTGIVAGDVDLDGLTDVLIDLNIYSEMMPLASWIGLFRCTGPLAFAKRVDVQTTPTAGFTSVTDAVAHSLALGDLDNDGRTDLVGAHKISLDSIFRMLGNGAGGFSGTLAFEASTISGSGAQGGNDSLATGDLDHDGNLDAVYGGSNALERALGNGSGGFGAGTAILPAGAFLSVALDDLDGDGNIDLVAADTTAANVSIALGNGAGGFGAPNIHAVGAGPLSARLGDLDNDGKLDLVTASSTAASLSVSLGTGSGGFLGATSYATSAGPNQIVLADLNLDGWLDAAVAHTGAPDGAVLYGNMMGGFGPKTVISLGIAQASVAVGDLQLNPFPELVFLSLETYSRATVCPNGVTGFSAPGPWYLVNLLTSARSSVEIADLDGDGTRDLIAVGSASNLAVRRGDGNGGWGPANWVWLGDLSSGALAVEDFDGDGRLDILDRRAGTVTLRTHRNVTAPPIGIVGFGAGTPGCEGHHGLQIFGTPKAGQQQFVLSCSNAPPSTVGLGLAVSAALPSGGDTLGLGVTFNVDLFGGVVQADFAVPSDASGRGQIAFVFPNNPQLAGIVSNMQVFWLWAGPCSPSPFGLSSSNAVTVTIQ